VARSVCVLAALLVLPGAAPRSGNARGVMEIDGRRRTYVLHVPAAYDGRVAWPLVIVLHGDGGRGSRMARLTGLDEKADAARFLVAYPDGAGWMNGHPRSWNAGACCGYAAARGIDDVAFIRALIEVLERRYRVDPSRIYVTGISNGGMMAHRLGCELADRIAAIAPVAGALVVSSCAPREPVSAMIFHGTADLIVRYEGGPSQADARRLDPPVSQAVAFWVARNACRQVPDRVERGPIRQERYPGGRGGTEVMLYTLEGGGHEWPGGRAGWLFGARPSQEPNATDLMWEFFSAHPKRLR